METDPYHEEEGWLELYANGLALLRDGGGRWHLIFDPSLHSMAESLLGARVTIQATRIDFDVLRVIGVEPV